MKLKCANWVEIKEIIYENINLKTWSKKLKSKRLGVAFIAKDKSKWNNNEWNECDES